MVETRSAKRRYMFRHCQLIVQNNAKVTGRLRDPDDCRLQKNDTGDLAKLSIGSQPHNFRLSRVKSEPTVLLNGMRVGYTYVPAGHSLIPFVLQFGNASFE